MWLIKIICIVPNICNVNSNIDEITSNSCILKKNCKYTFLLEKNKNFEKKNRNRIQGVSVQNVKYKVMITVGLSYIKKHSWWLVCSQESTIWVSSKKFQKSNIGWPQQPPTKKMLKFKTILFYQKIIVSKHQNQVIEFLLWAVKFRF